MIKIKELHAYYDLIEALKGIDMVIEKGKITCLKIGRASCRERV